MWWFAVCAVLLAAVPLLAVWAPGEHGSDENEEMIMADGGTCGARFIPEYGVEHVCTLGAGHPEGWHRGPAVRYLAEAGQPGPAQWPVYGPADGGDAKIVALARDILDSGEPDAAKVCLLLDLLDSAREP